MASTAAEVTDLSLADQGRGRAAWAPQEQRLLLVCLVLLCVLGSPYEAIGNAQEVLGPCDPSVVQQWSQPQIMPIASRLADTTPEASSGAVRLDLPRKAARRHSGPGGHLTALAPQVPGHHGLMPGVQPHSSRPGAQCLVG